ncbi:MAG: endolytic transglycosylase MltG [Bacteroidales bacterium]|nr:endolytic transglycosylase MltG [Bacteroidales bacterium]
MENEPNPAPEQKDIVKSPNRKLKRLVLKWLILISAVLILTGGILFYLANLVWLRPNISANDSAGISVYIPTGSTYDEVLTSLYSKDLVNRKWTFEWLARKKNYPALVKPGHYVFYDRMNNNEVINILRAGLQTPVHVVINNVRLKQDLARKIALQIEADSLSIITMLNDTDYLKKYNLRAEHAMILCIPNTYEFYWNTSAVQFFERMKNEYEKFWNGERQKGLARTGLTREEVITLASIIEKETLKDDEKSRMAGVYINRLRKGWKLQADPTVVYAAGDFTIRRVLNKHLAINSPYNTYMHFGLPPGPICLPSIASIDAVLTYEENGYFYFCAKEDRSGYHNFARTYSEHLINARKYQRALRQ